MTEENCSVCLGGLCAEDTAMIPDCGHNFCVTCIMSWSKLNSCCPICKRAFRSLLVRKDSDGTPVMFGDELGWIEESLRLLEVTPWVKIHKVDPNLAPLSDAEAIAPLRGSFGLETYGVLAQEYEDQLEEIIEDEEDETWSQVLSLTTKAGTDRAKTRSKRQGKQ